MKYYINIVFILSAIFFSCAVQSPPTGGVSDTQGPYIKSIDPPNGTFYFKGDIEIVFNEMIDPNTIKSSISIFPDTPVQISSFNNRIVIKSQNQWPKDQIFKIKLSRNISDFHGNKLNRGKILTYNTDKEIPIGNISGKLFNNNGISNIGLYKLDQDSIIFLYSVENNNNNEFEFQNLSNGKYLLIGLENSINNIKEDIRINRYALMSEKIAINSDTINNCNLNFSYPAIQKKTKLFQTQNLEYATIEFDDGEKKFLINKKYTNNFETLSEDIIPFDEKDDSIRILLNNNVEFYDIIQKINKPNTINDNLNPYIADWYLDKDNIIVKFSEPIIFKNEVSIFKMSTSDSLYNPINLNYELLDPMTVIIKNDLFNSSKLVIENKFICDLSSNSNILIDTLLTISNNTHFSNKKVGGNIFGKIIYEGKNEVVVEAINILNDNVYKKKINKFGDYKFYNLDVGKYQIWAYENLNQVNESYFNGTIEPIQFSAKFGYYNGIIETRAKWDIEDIRIKIN